jgi:hypothetical protein
MVHSDIPLFPPRQLSLNCVERAASQVDGRMVAKVCDRCKTKTARQRIARSTPVLLIFQFSQLLGHLG